MLRHLVLTVLVLVFAPCAYAATVSKVKNSNALIDLAGGSANPGDVYYAVGSDGKRKALIKITRVKGNQAIGEIMKGKPASGMRLELRPGKVASGGGGSRRQSRASGGESGDASATRAYWGLLVGYGMDSMSVNVNTASGVFYKKVSLSGTGFSAKGLLDYELFPQVWFRGTTGLEQFNVSGSADCGPGNNQACNAEIMYMTFDFLGRYVFSNGSFRPWVGGGAGLLFPMSKESTALAANSIATTNVILISGGFDFFSSKTVFFPVSIEYGMLPKSDEVEASWIALRGGFGMSF